MLAASGAKIARAADPEHVSRKNTSYDVFLRPPGILVPRGDLRSVGYSLSLVLAKKGKKKNTWAISLFGCWNFGFRALLGDEEV